ncbi:hypothetical protein NNO07_22480 [Pseudomonas resinovorans]|uniref:Cyanophage baseplate Pam3 plug gp18 domain-containing protein n=1 Tax=Metapseudomonas resinovorans TaxID=53412 RepID=A0ABT4YAD2_METRE|nr:hypothetical protein [Pseudomonas resinovorans]MDA8485843.1 hypothetical protein [Pseudomonas resinovorans]
MNVIPLIPTPGQRLQIVLENQNVTLAVRQKGPRMYVDLDVGTTRVMSGAICNDRTNIKQYKTMAFNGGLFFIDTQGNEAPHYSGLGTRWVLLYLTEAEYDQLYQETDRGAIHAG